MKETPTSVIRREQASRESWRIVARAVNNRRDGLSPDWWSEIEGNLTRSEAADKFDAIKRNGLTPL